MNYYNKIKETFIKNEIYKKTKDYFKERNDLRTYYNVGKLLNEAGKHYGERIVEKYSKQLTIDLGKGYSKRNLWLMLRFYELKEKMQTVSAHLSWSHYCELIPLKSIEEIEYYIEITELNSLSVRQLRDKIRLKEYERLPKKTKEKLENKNRLEFTDTVKDPIIIKVKEIPESLKEKVLKEYILNDMDNFLKELGEEITYVGKEYKIEYKNHNYFIDILLFSIKYNCYIVVELKIGDLKKENIIQTEFYTDLVDQKVRKIHHNKTIGIIISRKNDEYIIKFSTNSVISTTYKLVNS